MQLLISSILQNLFNEIELLTIFKTLLSFLINFWCQLFPFNKTWPGEIELIKIFLLAKNADI